MAVVELQVAQRWADFTKALAIYPETNERVQRNMERLREALAETHNGVRLVFHEDVLDYGTGEHEFERRSSLAWLRRRLDHAALAGARMLPDASEEALLAFCQRILANFLNKLTDVTIQELWPDTYPGIELIDRRFEGTFGERPNSAGGIDVGGRRDGLGGNGTVAGPLADGDATRRGAEVADEELTGRFLAGILAEPRVVRRMTNLQCLVEEGWVTMAGERVSAPDLLKRAMEELSAEATENRGSLIEALCTAIDEICVRARSGNQQQVEEGREEFVQALRELGHSYFARAGGDVKQLTSTQTTDKTAAPGGSRKRDGQIGDDVEALVEEMKALPRALPFDLTSEDPESRLETLGALLHYSVYCEDPEQLVALERVLDERLEQIGRGELAALEMYARKAREDEEDGELVRRALIRLIGRLGKPHLLQGLRLMDEDYVVSEFPRHFDAYLSTIDRDDSIQYQTLGRTCTRLGPSQFAEAAEKLGRDLRRLEADQVSALLERPDEARLPLVRILVETHPDVDLSEVVAYLRELDLSGGESFLLYQLPDPRFMTREYLSALIGAQLGTVRQAQVHAAISRVLCEHIRVMREHEPRGKARMDSIRNLARCPSVDGRKMLDEILQAGGFRIRGREPMAVRRLARSIRKYYAAA